MADRVDKNWQKAGLKDYSNEAILGTLAHYGAKVDEGAFRKLAESEYPLGIAEQWHHGWKGTGQFAKFPFAAAQELWGRWVKDRMRPSEFAEALGKLIVALSQLLDGRQDAPVGSAFKEVEGRKARVPQKDGGAEERFVQEVFGLLGEQMLRAFDELAEQLAGAGHTDDAEEFAKVEEFVVPTRAGVSTAVVKAVSGKRDEAVGELEKIAGDSARNGYGRLSAVDALIHLGSDKARGFAEQLLEDAEKSADHHLALGVLGRVAHILDKTQDIPGMRALEERAKKISAAHDEAHPHHKHHGHSHG